MGQRGQHVLIVDNNVARQCILEMILERTGRWVTIAQNGDEAMAVLKSTLHPLIVMVNARITYPLDGQRASLLRLLLANQEFTATHAFIVTAAPRAESELRELQETIQQLGAAAHVGWLEPPNRFAKIVTTTDEAERYIKSRP